MRLFWRLQKQNIANNTTKASSREKMAVSDCTFGTVGVEVGAVVGVVVIKEIEFEGGRVFLVMSISEEIGGGEGGSGTLVIRVSEEIGEVEGDSSSVAIRISDG